MGLKIDFNAWTAKGQVVHTRDEVCVRVCVCQRGETLFKMDDEGAVF